MRSRRHRSPIAALFLAALAGFAAAQENAWVSHGPTDVGVVNDVAVGDSVAYAATVNGTFRSDDGAATWRPSGFGGRTVDRIVAHPGTAAVLASLQGALYVSRDRAETWAPIPGLFGLAAIDPGTRRPSMSQTATPSGSPRTRVRAGGASRSSPEAPPGLMDSRSTRPRSTP